MATITFNNSINVSVQPGDTIYFSSVTNNQSGRNHPTTTGPNTHVQKFGVVTAVNHNTNTITINPASLSTAINANHYVFFSKDRRVNLSGIVGYYAETEYQNFSKLPAEMFATAANYVESSK